jgi:membrane associated rhomboid family serine protease
MDARAWDGQLWRLPASALPHIGLVHLAFNLYWLWVFGTAAEAVLGHLRFALIALMLATGSSAAEYAVSTGGVGLSGVGYGLFGLLLVLGRRDRRLAGVVTGQTVVLFVAWFFFCWIMTETGNWRVGNMAHAAGAILGLLLGGALAARGRWRLILTSALAGGLAIAVIGAVMRAPRPEELAYLGWLDLEAGRYVRAADRLERAVAADPKQASSWQNLGVARQRLGRIGPAAEAYRQAVKLRPNDKALRADLAWALSTEAYDKHMNGELAGAIKLYREAIEADDRTAATWYNLGLAYWRLGEFEQAREAFRRTIELDPADVKAKAALVELAP